MISLGPHSKIRIGVTGNVNAYAVCAGSSLHYRTEIHDVTDSESNNDQAGDDQQLRYRREPGRGEAELRLVANKTRGSNPHVAPLNIVNGKTIDTILVYPDGLTGPVHTLRKVLISELGLDPLGNPAQPNQLAFTGTSNNYLLPS